MPSDLYVRMLNELDEKLTARGLPTRVVFLIYVDLLWAPQTQRLANQDRFVLMFAPITRTYTSTYAQGMTGVDTATLAPYERNRLQMPRDVAANVAHLRRWQAQFSGDSFVFDYHLMWEPARDLGGAALARVLCEDMKNLHALGLNGMVSCQLQRVALPTGLAICAMAQALWDADTDFDAFARAHYAQAFGADSEAVWQYQNQLSALLHLPALRGEEPLSADHAADFARIPQLNAALQPLIEANLHSAAQPDANVRRSWEYLAFLCGLSERVAAALRHKALGDTHAAQESWRAACDYACAQEAQVHTVFDRWLFTGVGGEFFR